MSRTLAHDLFLLSLAEGRRTRRQQVAFGLAGSVLADLALAGRIDLGSQAVVVRSTAPTGQPSPDWALAEIAGDKPRQTRRWVEKLRGETGKRTVSELLAAGVVRDEQGRFLGFTSHRYPEPDTRQTDRLRADLVDLVSGGRSAARDLRLVTLVSLIQATGLGGHVLPGVPKRQLKQRVTELEAGADPSQAIRKAVESAYTRAAVAGAT